MSTKRGNFVGERGNLPERENEKVSRWPGRGDPRNFLRCSSVSVGVGSASRRTKRIVCCAKNKSRRHLVFLCRAARDDVTTGG